MVNRRVLSRIGLACLLIMTGLLVQLGPRLAAAQDEPLRVALVLNGTLGDQSFFDSAAEGIERMEAELNVEAEILEAGYDRARWEPALAEAAEGDYDVIIAGTFDMVGYLAELAPEYPDKRFILFDDVVDYSSGCCDNVLSIQYRTADAAYLAGYAAAKVSESGVLGTILGAEGGPVLDFAVGFEQGAAAANPDSEVLRAVVGGANPYSDPARGRELTLAQIEQGADVIFPIAGASGIGALQAARDEGVLAIGVDSDQAALFEETDPAQAEVIFTSVLKNVGESLFIAVEATINGTAEYGSAITLGLADGAVGIVEGETWNEVVPEEVQAEVDNLREQIVSGEIDVEGVIE